MYYAPKFATHLDHADRIVGLYEYAGMPAPDHSFAIQRAIDQQPGTHEVALTLAQEALTATDVDEFIADAAARMSQAQAVDMLRDTLQRTIDAALTESLPERVDEAAADLTPTFDKLVAGFKRAVAKLPERAPLDQQAVIDADATKEYRAALHALHALAEYAGALHTSQVEQGLGNAPASIAQVLTILELPEIEVEIVDTDARRLTGMSQALNENELRGTRTVRRLCNAIEKDIDHALIEVARNKFDGVQFKLTNTEGMRHRREQTSDAFTQRGHNATRKVRIV